MENQEQKPKKHGDVQAEEKLRKWLKDVGLDKEKESHNESRTD